MAGLSKKQLEIKNQALMDYIKAAICVLDDQTTEARHKTAYTAGLLSVAEEGANRNVARGYFTPTPKWRIRYADGTVGYQLYERKYAVEIAEKALQSTIPKEVLTCPRLNSSQRTISISSICWMNFWVVLMEHLPLSPVIIN